MRLSIFSRILLAQSALIGLILLLSLFALEKLNSLMELDASILTIDSTCIKEEKQLLKVFLSEMRNGEKYLVLHDSAFRTALEQGSTDFVGTLGKIAVLADTEREQELTREIKGLHEKYVQEITVASVGTGKWDQAKRDLSDEILDRANELIRTREQIIANKAADARDVAADAASTMGWMTMGGIAGALILALLHARGVSGPLKRLAKEMQRVGKGDLTPAPHFAAPKEVDELARTFNRMTERLAQLDRLKADFTAHVSHELRTPLTAIREGTALMLENVPGPLNPAQQEILEVVRNHSDRLFQCISSILDLSKMDAEMMEYDFTACDLCSLIQRSLASVELIARKKGIQVEKDLPDSLPLLHLDESRINQVFDNLLSNALKFTPEGGRISVGAAVVSADGGKGKCVEVRVSDTGEGIPEEELEEVFKRFYQSSRTAGKRYQGTGLGLAIAQHVIEVHTGKIRAESRSGNGSSFIFTLPIPPVDETQTLCEASQGKPLRA